MAKKVKWGRSEDGYVESICGRYKITPQFCGRALPIWYEVEDTGPDPYVGTAIFETQKACKAWVERELNPPVSDHPKITRDML